MNDPAVRRQKKDDPLEVAIYRGRIVITHKSGHLTSAHIGQAAARLIRYRFQLMATEVVDR